MRNTIVVQTERILWDLIACGPNGSGPFRLALHYSLGSITEYFQDVNSALHAVETAEKRVDSTPNPALPNKLMVGVAGHAELVKFCFSEEAWASEARH